MADLTCSFCGKLKSQVFRLISGPQVYICDECVDLCVDIIKDERDTAGPLRTVRVTRKITFPPHCLHAGLSLLNGAARVIQDRLPSLVISFTLQARRLTAELAILASPEGQAEVEKVLEDYGRLLQDRLRPEDCVREPGHAEDLRRRLAMTAVELRLLAQGPDSEGEDGVEERARRLQQALGWILCGELEDIEELFT